MLRWRCLDGAQPWLPRKARCQIGWHTLLLLASAWLFRLAVTATDDELKEATGTTQVARLGAPLYTAVPRNVALKDCKACTIVKSAIAHARMDYDLVALCYWCKQAKGANIETKRYLWHPETYLKF